MWPIRRASLLTPQSFAFRVPPAAADLPRPVKDSAGGKKKTKKKTKKAGGKKAKKTAALKAAAAADPLLYGKVRGILSDCRLIGD